MDNRVGGPQREDHRGAGRHFLDSIRLFLIAVPAIFCGLAPNAAVASGLEGLDSLAIASAGTASDDRRVDVKTFGIKTGCKGDTVEANIQFTRMTVKFRADGAHVVLSYIGEYTRQGWSFPCIKVSSLFNGVEYVKISGQYSFRVSAAPGGSAIIDNGVATSLQSIADVSHDSNQQAMRAVRNAITLH